MLHASTLPSSEPQCLPSRGKEEQQKYMNNMFTAELLKACLAVARTTTITTATYYYYCHCNYYCYFVTVILYLRICVIGIITNYYYHYYCYYKRACLAVAKTSMIMLREACQAVAERLPACLH